jgi:AraC-like DNA-binding protein
MKTLELPRDPMRASLPRITQPTQNGSVRASHIDYAPREHAARLSRQLVGEAMKTPVLCDLLPLAAGFCTNDSHAVSAPPLNPGEAMLLYCTKGEGWCELGSCRHRLQPGDLCVIPPETLCTYGADPGGLWTFSWVHAAGANLGFFLSQLAGTPVIRAGEDARLLRWILELRDILRPDCALAELLYASQTLAHLLSALICLQRDQRRTGTDVARNIERSIDYMRQHLDEPVRAATLATVANMSLPHYFALFKRCIGSTPIDYLIKLRMEHARRLLAETCWSVKQIAASLGYEDPLYFSRVFKSVTQDTPSDYRRGGKSFYDPRSGPKPLP